MRCLILSLMLALPPQAPQPLPPQAPPPCRPEPPKVIPQPLPAAQSWEVRRVPCGTVVTAISQTFRDGSHLHVCPNCGTSWRHGGRSGGPQSHVCPGFKEVRVPVTQPARPRQGTSCGCLSTGEYPCPCQRQYGPNGCYCGSDSVGTVRPIPRAIRPLIQSVAPAAPICVT